MRTSELIATLSAAGAAPARPAAPGRRLVAAALGGAALALLALLATLGLQPAMAASWFWMKAGYGLAGALAGLLLLIPLSRPGARIGVAGLAVLAVALAALGAMATYRAMNTGAEGQEALWFGHTWQVCPWRIAGLAIPTYLAAVSVLRRLAPTRLASAGGAAGLLAGGVAAVVYGLYCQESSAPFVAVWYSLGMAVSALAGGLAGPRILRW